ncbi:LysR family transcriptional regulator [Cycloclasticus sp. 46_120_T64]|nr:LysR family transcriptional regulator [Cycloclasticus sp. 46_120_T64]
MLNYKHLHYFWVVAKEGSIAKASERLHITPQTISGQLSRLEENLGVKLFVKSGRNIEITETGRLVLNYTDEIFSLGSELEQMLQNEPEERPQLFRVGIADVVPKSIAQGILLPVLQTRKPTRLICKETGLDTLLADLAVHRLDLVIADRPIPSTVSTRGFNHKLGECSISFFAKESIINRFNGDFPQCLSGMPMLLPTRGTQLRSDIDQWISKTRIHPKIVAEFDDSALMKSFGQKAAGVFIAPTVLRKEVEDQYNVKSIGEVSEIKEAFYAISVERRVTNAITATVIKAANNMLFN